MLLNEETLDEEVVIGKRSHQRVSFINMSLRRSGIGFQFQDLKSSPLLLFQTASSHESFGPNFRVDHVEAHRIEVSTLTGTE
jgi:hypothetical protein